MTAVVSSSALDAPLDAAHEASEPPEVRGRDRADVRLLVSNGVEDVVHTTFSDLPRALQRGDVVVVNSSATIAAAIAGTLPDGTSMRVHFSTEMPVASGWSRRGDTPG
jgi:S-adenosylmethionine:tRNA ribosyltransferase-isomerase